ncbi:MAG: glucuronate isomerase [Gemmatimonadota bacterium]|nr:glucuronate isomerase [Gemmatimonadota bacterium]
MAHTLYEETHDLPLVCPHGHVDPRILAEDAPFPEPTALIVTPDHYILRMLYSQGIPLEALGVPRRDGAPVEADPRRAWQIFGEHVHLFRGTPTGVWLNHQLVHVFGVRKKLFGETARAIYDEMAEKLSAAEFYPRALFLRFNIEVLATTDAATDSLEHHRTIRESEWPGRVVPTFRPDALFRIAAPGWGADVDRLGSMSGATLTDYASFIEALRERRAFFRTMGGTSTDHGVVEPRTAQLADEEAELLFRKARNGEASAADQSSFEAHMLMEMARMSLEDGLVMQLHAGSLRDHNQQLFELYGVDRGGDIPLATEYTRNLRALLNAYGNDPRLTLVLFTLDESTYARELAPLAGHYPAVRLGPPWWFHDSIQGMRRFRERTTETAGIYNTVGFNDDTRAFCSIPARHDLSRRVDANFLAGQVAHHIIDLQDAREMARALAHDLAWESYRFAAGAADALLSSGGSPEQSTA